MHVSTWKNLENIVLSEIIRHKKEKYCMISVNDISKRRTFIETECRSWRLPGVSSGQEGQ